MLQNLNSEVVRTGLSILHCVFMFLVVVVQTTFPSQALAQSPLISTPSNGSLSWKGITLYGIVDVGLQYQSHGAPISDYYPAGSAEVVQKNSRRPIFGVVSNQMALSRVGLTGVEAIGLGDLQGVFRVETYFNPSSGQLSDALRSMANNNGRPLAEQTTNADSALSGKVIEQGYLGLSSRKWGTLTWGRQNAILSDLILKYDPNQSAQGFSPVGVTGIAGGAGAGQDRRFSNSLKYEAGLLSALHVSAQYKFSNSQGGARRALELGLGGTYAGLSVDVIYAETHDAIAAGPLSAAQVAGFPGLNPGFSLNNALSGTISDNRSLTVGALFVLGGRWKFYAGGEYIQLANPLDPVFPGANDLGYRLAYVNGTAFPHPKQFQVYWAGTKFTPVSRLDLTLAYYGYHQNSFGAGPAAGCSDSSAATCAGRLQAGSLNLDYRLSKRFDLYAGSLYSLVQDGLASGYPFSKNNFSFSAGMRFKF